MTQEEKVKAIAEKVMRWKEVDPETLPMHGEFILFNGNRVVRETDIDDCGNVISWFCPYANDADALMVLMHFPQWSACADETDTWVGFYCTAEEGFSVEHGFKVMARDEPDPAQRLRTCICEAALKACEAART